MTDRLHLSPRHRTVLLSLLREHLPGVEVWAYGSRVTGRSHDGSDLDLVLRGPDLEEIPIGRLVDFEDAVRESTIPFLVEARDWARLPERFHREIERDHVVVQDRATREAQSGWREVTLGDVITLQRGFDLPNTERQPGPHPVIASTGPVGTHQKASVKGPGVVIGRSGSLGGGQFIVSDYWPLNTTLWVKDFHGNDRRFCYYLLKSLNLADFNAGSGVPSLNRNHIHPIPVKVPGVPQQRAIANILGILDDKIDLNRRMNETLEAMARAIYKDWFVDFGPIRAKAEGRTPYLAPETWKLFPDTLDDKDKPVGWITRPVNDLFEFNPRETVKKGTNTPYLDMAALPTVGAVPNAPTRREYKSGSKFRDGDTLFARITPCLENGKTAYVFNLGKEVIGTGSTEFIVIRSRSPLPQPTSYLLARDLAFRAHAEQGMTGTTGRQRTSADVLSKYEITTPTEGRLWKALSDVVDPMMDRVIANALESRALARTRDLLLPKLMSGEIRLHEAEAAVKAVT